MQKGIQTRLVAHNILFNLQNNTKNNFDEIFNLNSLKYKLSLSDKKMVHNIVLSSMRYHHYIKKIIKRYVKKSVNTDQYLLILSATTQMIFLNFKEYAVINCTVELAKNKKIKAFPGFINAVLKKILIDKKKLQKIKIKYNDLPDWFVEKSKKINSINKYLFIDTIIKKPSLHIVFKEEQLIKNFNYEYRKISSNSLVVNNNIQINKLPRFNNGEWWIQDYSSMLPIHLTNNLKEKKIIDLCAAPGGKAFQIISKNANLDLIEINPNRANILINNLKRLNIDGKVKIENSLNLNESKKYDFVIIDAPCSAVGTIRRNPEIFFRNTSPKFNEIKKIQTNLLNKGKKLINSKGTIIYMVCSFLEIETTNLIDDFLKKNPQFTINKFLSNENNKELIDERGFINIIPKTFDGINIDGFFAAKLKYKYG